MNLFWLFKVKILIRIYQNAHKTLSIMFVSLLHWKTFIFLTISHIRKIKTSISVERIESLQNAAVNLPLSMAWEQFGSVRNSSLAIILAYYVDFRMLFVLFLSYHTLLWRIPNMIPIKSFIFQAGQSSTLFAVVQASWPWLPTEERAPMVWPPVQEGAFRPGRIWSQGRLPDHLHFPRFCRWDSLQWTCKHDPPKIYVFIITWWTSWGV